MHINFLTMIAIRLVEKNSQLGRKFSSGEKIFNSRENSQCKRKLLTQEKITNAGEKYW